MDVVGVQVPIHALNVSGIYNYTITHAHFANLDIGDLLVCWQNVIIVVLIVPHVMVLMIIVLLALELNIISYFKGDAYVSDSTDTTFMGKILDSIVLVSKRNSQNSICFTLFKLLLG